jgi:hypothetical protein
VVKDMADTQEQGRTGQEISRLFDIAGRENEVVATLAVGMDQLRAVQAAKRALTKLTPADVGAALDYRRRQPEAGAATGGEMIS